MTPYLSNKIRVLSFLSMILIVMLHANVMEISIGQSRYIQKTMTEEITRIAVPLFFLISGYLFFIHCDGSRTFFLKKMRRRVRSLVVPYLILTILGGVVLFIAKKEDSLWYSIIDSILISPKFFYQLWFAHDLIIMSFLSPLFYLFLKKIPHLWILVCPVWLTGHYWSLLNIVTIESLFFWGMGGIIALHFPKLAEYQSVNRKDLVTGILIFWLFISFFIAYTGRPFYIHGLNLLMGIYVIWGGYDIIYPLINHYLPYIHLTKYSFFLYLFHEPVLTGIKKLMLLIVELNQFTSLAIYITAPILTIFIVLYSGMCLKKYVPSLFQIINGGR